MPINAWVLRKLDEGGFDASEADDVVIVHGRDQPDVRVFCPEPGAQAFTTADLDVVLQNHPNLDFVVMIKRPTGAGVFEVAGARGVRIVTFGVMQIALQVGDLAYIHRDEEYLLRRIGMHRSVDEVVRTGLTAWRVKRQPPLPPRHIVTHDRYEFTDDELRTLLSDYQDFGIDTFVSTNPNARGFGARVIRTADDTGVRIRTLDEFIRTLHLA